jgi:hypothetical protein
MDFVKFVLNLKHTLFDAQHIIESITEDIYFKMFAEGQ